jgi:RND superfamily putative drug exporter
LVRTLRDDLPGLAHDAVVLVGGDPALDADINNELSSKLPYIIGLVLLLSFFILLVFLRSLLLPLKAVLLNLGSVGAAYGMLVLVFQKGFGEGLLGFEAQGHIDPFLPVFLFCILFGLSMDYEVFMLSRIREEYQRSHDNTEAVGWGLERTAGIITSAAAIMVTVFGGFAAATLIPIKAMGFGLAVAVFLDATLIRAVMVPASMRLMGDWNWWLPGWLDRILPNVSLEEAPPLSPVPSET